MDNLGPKFDGGAEYAVGTVEAFCAQICAASSLDMPEPGVTITSKPGV